MTVKMFRFLSLVSFLIGKWFLEAHLLFFLIIGKTKYNFGKQINFYKKPVFNNMLKQSF